MSTKIFLAACILSGMVSCTHDKKPVISEYFVDSLIKNYKEPEIARSNDSSMQFWEDRMNPKLPGFVSETKYAGTLSTRFHLFGNIQDIRKAELVIRKIDSDFNHYEAHANLTLISYSILQHRFHEADAFLKRAEQTGLKKYDHLTASFDVDFELGRYFDAGNELKELKPTADYGYFFRRSKMEHLNGLLDSSIHSMLQAAYLENGNSYLAQVALGNAADLYVHAGDLETAAGLYMDCARMNSADFHSIIGIGWIALVNDKNDSLAERIFKFVRTKNKLPDALYKLTQMAEAREDTILEKNWAHAFELEATDSAYGNMYNKYMIELYTGVLGNPFRAEQISIRELKNRATPQTCAWYAWTLFCNNKKEEAYQEFEKNVSGRPLEALELYWMGRLMQGLGKGYNARMFYKAAYTNKYDLSPKILKDLEEKLKG